ncbi:MAG: hypothetical protein JJE27_05695 [Thermoleophilia bacterium]|nr:hypothetical protein [Thermoleophilia bacterium]
MDTVMHIFEAVGVGAAAGLSPLVAIAAVVIFAAVHLGLDPNNGDIGFVEGVALVAIAGLILAQSFLMILSPNGVKVRIAADRPRTIALQLPLAVAIGGLAGAMVFNAEGHSAVVGAILGGMPAALVAVAATGLLGGVTRRLEARHATEAAKAEPEDGAVAKPVTTEGRVLAAGVDVVTIVAVAVALTAPPVALVLPVLAVLLLVGGKRREAKKHEGLRVLR